MGHNICADFPLQLARMRGLKAQAFLELADTVELQLARMRGLKDGECGPNRQREKRLQLARMRGLKARHPRHLPARPARCNSRECVA